MVTSYVFKTLTNADYISGCSGVLDNRMTCRKAATVIETSQIPNLGYCNQHKALLVAALYAEQQAEVAAIESAEVVTEEPNTNDNNTTTTTS